MGEGRLSLPKASEKVEVVYITPRLICTSRHAIKIYADKLLNRRKNWFVGGVSLSVLLTTAPLAVTEQKFNSIWFISAEVLSLLVNLLALGSLISLFVSATLCVANWNKANSDYMIHELINDGDSLERSDRENTADSTIPMDRFTQKT